MPEGPEVRKYADALDAALTGRAIVSLEARTKDARKWLHDNEPRLVGRRVERVVSHGKHLLGDIEGDFFFHSHLMMWGRWQTFGPTKGRRKSKPIELPEKDRRERARIVVEGAVAGLGNYLRAEVLFNCKLNPWRTVSDLTQRNLSCLSKTIPTLARDAYKRGATAAE